MSFASQAAIFRFLAYPALFPWNRGCVVLLPLVLRHALPFSDNILPANPDGPPGPSRVAHLIQQPLYPAPGSFRWQANGGTHPFPFVVRNSPAPFLLGEHSIILSSRSSGRNGFQSNHLSRKGFRDQVRRRRNFVHRLGDLDVSWLRIPGFGMAPCTSIPFGRSHPDDVLGGIDAESE